MTEQAEQSPPQLNPFTPEDVVQAILLIDEGINQGAYKGWEAIQRVIAVRARLLLFAQSWENTIAEQEQTNNPSQTQETVQ